MEGKGPYRGLIGKIGVTAATAPKFWSCVKVHRLEKSSIGMFSILVGAIVGAVVGAVVGVVVGRVVGAEVGGVVGGVVGAVVGALVGLAPHAEGAVVVVVTWPYP